jgi:hypothetical protein
LLFFEWRASARNREAMFRAKSRSSVKGMLPKELFHYEARRTRRKTGINSFSPFHPLHFTLYTSPFTLSHFTFSHRILRDLRGFNNEILLRKRRIRSCRETQARGIGPREIVTSSPLPSLLFPSLLSPRVLSSSPWQLPGRDGAGGNRWRPGRPWQRPATSPRRRVCR